MKNLLFQTAFLGDLLLSIPLIKNLKKQYPQAELHLVCRKPFGAFFLSLGLVDAVFEVDKKNKESLKSLKKNLAEQSYHTIFCPHESFRSAWMCGKIEAKEKFSFRRWFSSWFFNRLVARPTDLPDVLRQTSLLAAQNKDFGIEWFSYVSEYRGAQEQCLESLTENRLPVPEFLSMKVDKDLQIEMPTELVLLDLESCIAIAPGSVWPTKRWSEEHFVSFAKARLEKVLVLGGPGEKELCEEITVQIPGAINLAGKTSLEQLYCILKQVKFLVCNDSGTMHMAAVAGCNSITPFGPTTLDIGYRPWSNQALVAQIDLKCRPCGLHGHKKCPIGTHECMKALKPEQVEVLATQFDSSV